MDPVQISALITILILVAAAGFGIYTRTKGANVGIKDLEFLSDENKAKRKARRQKFGKGVREGMGNLDEEERKAIEIEIVEAGQALVALGLQVGAGSVDPKAALKAAQEIADVVREVREGIAD